MLDYAGIQGRLLLSIGFDQESLLIGNSLTVLALPTEMEITVIYEF